MKKILAILLFLCLTFSQLFAHNFPMAKCDTIKSTQNGNWKLASTWNRGRRPAAGDTVIIVHEVTLDTIGNCRKLKYKGTGKLNMTVNSILHTGL
jgi:hypothetical protein